MIVVLAVTDLAHGAGYLLSAPATAPTLLLLNAFVPLPIWGAALVIAAAALLTHRRLLVVGFAVGAAAHLVWAVFNVLALVTGVANGWAWAPFLGLAALHAGGLWFAGRSAGRARTSRTPRGS